VEETLVSNCLHLARSPSLSELVYQLVMLDNSTAQRDSMHLQIILVFKAAVIDSKVFRLVKSDEKSLVHTLILVKIFL
jgi:BarA-like signal transduction histidine kinase